jgi:hypothetical protein
MAKTLVPNASPTHDEIAAQAYQIYLREGCVAGRDLEHWLQAEAELVMELGMGIAAVAKLSRSRIARQNPPRLWPRPGQSQQLLRATQHHDGPSSGNVGRN